MPLKILVADDESAIRRLLRKALERAGYEVIEAMNARDALTRARTDTPDAILLDLGLPDRDGLSLLPLLCDRARTVILVVSARHCTEEKVAALDLGAEDYITKPFDSDELLARLRVALRHRTLPQSTHKVICRGDLTIDIDQRSIHRAGEELHLTRKEHEVLAILATHVDRVVTHDRIMAAAWAGEDARIEYLRVVIRNLRQKLEAPNPIGSVIANELSVGYRLRADP